MDTMDQARIAQEIAERVAFGTPTGVGFEPNQPNPYAPPVRISVLAVRNGYLVSNESAMFPYGDSQHIAATFEDVVELLRKMLPEPGSQA